MLHIYVGRQHNETHQTLFEKRRRGEGNIMAGRVCEHVPDTLYTCMELP
jgi:hypothetical protein